MKNVQVTIDQDTLTQVDRLARPLGLKRSAIVRQALRQWVQRQAVERFERDWITAVRKHPDDQARADEWREAQTWSRR